MRTSTGVGGSLQDEVGPGPTEMPPKEVRTARKSAVVTMVESQTARATARPENEPAESADVFVIFGITGDLAKVMTFRSLYRLERRGLLSCPILGVSVDDWSVDHLREHARECIAGTGEAVDDEVFSRLAARLSYVQGDFGDAATYQRVREAIGTAERPVFYLEIPPF